MNLHNRDIDHEEVPQRAGSRRISQQLQLWETTVSSTPAPENLHDRHAEDVEHLVRGKQLRNHSFLHCLTQALSFAQHGHVDDQPRTALSSTLSMNGM